MTAKATQYYYTRYQSPLGGITLSSDGEALTGLWFDGQKYYCESLPAARGVERGDLSVFAESLRWLDTYFSGGIPPSAPPLYIAGSDFRRRVCHALMTIPYGQTITYGELARRINVKSAQAVGGAVAHNPISLIVPCHRVVGSGGKLTGYAGGIERKRWLLQLEHRLSAIAGFAPVCQKQTEQYQCRAGQEPGSDLLG